MIRKVVTVTLEINVARLVESYEKEQSIRHSTGVAGNEPGPLQVTEMIEDQFHWVKGSGIKLKSIDTINND